MITVNHLKKDKEIETLIVMTDKSLGEMGYTEHGFRHLNTVVRRAAFIFESLGKTADETELLKVSAFLHDIGNAVNRQDHALSGAILAYNLLTARGMEIEKAAQIMMAIGNHDEHYGIPVSDMAAALILADKSDVHKTRVRKNKIEKNTSNKLQDIHDRVNAAVDDSDLDIDSESKEIILRLVLNAQIASPMEYFEIFLKRMQMCKSAAVYLGYTFRLKANDYFLA